MTRDAPHPPAEPAGALSAELAFQTVWETMADMLGTAAAATLVRRAAKHVGAAHPELGLHEFAIVREGFEYSCRVPAPWTRGALTFEAVRPLLREIAVLLHALTGTVVLSRLQAHPGFEHTQLFSIEEQR